MSDHDGDLSAEIEQWLAEDIPGVMEDIVEAARNGQRTWRGSSKKLTVSIQRPNVHDLNKSMGYVTPTDLRAIADNHDRHAAELQNDAEYLRDMACQLDEERGCGPALLEHMAVMRDEEQHSQDVYKAKWEIESGENGISKWEAISSQVRWALSGADLLTVGDVREAYRSGRLHRVKGIGPARFEEIQRALLADERSTGEEVS
jgi:hypothetical protein